MRYRSLGAAVLLRRNLLLYGVGGMVLPFAGIKLIDTGWCPGLGWDLVWFALGRQTRQHWTYEPLTKFSAAILARR